MPASAATSAMGRRTASWAISSPDFMAGGFPSVVCGRPSGRCGRYRPAHPAPKSAILGPVDVATFLRSHAPFDELDAAGIEAVVDATDVVFLLKGESLWDPGGDPLAHVYVVRSGSVDLLDDGELVDQAGEGELVGAVSMLAV